MTHIRVCGQHPPYRTIPYTYTLYLGPGEAGEDLREAGNHQHQKNEHWIDDVAGFLTAGQLLIVSRIETSPANLGAKDRRPHHHNTHHILKQSQYTPHPQSKVMKVNDYLK